MASNESQDAPSSSSNDGSGPDDKVMEIVEQVKVQFTPSEQSEVHEKFSEALHQYREDIIDTLEFIYRVSRLFRDHHNILLRFNDFLPEGYAIESRQDPENSKVIIGYKSPNMNFCEFSFGPESAVGGPDATS